MPYINQVVIAGNLTRDPETKHAGSLQICELSLAVNKSRKKGDDWTTEVSFFDVTAFAKVADAAGSLTKGQSVVVIGELKQERWERDGQKRSAVKIIASAVAAVAADDRTSQERPESRDEYAQAPRHAEQPPPNEIPFGLLWLLLSLAAMGGMG